MIEHAPQEEVLHLIKEIESNPESTQRTISQRLDISLGKTNYLLKELMKKGFIKARNFSTRANKLKKIQYILTPKGFQVKMHLMKHFLEKKETEYLSLKQEWEDYVASQKIETEKLPV